MIENIVAYIYSITGLIFFIAWQMNYSLTKYFFKEKNFNKTLYLELFFLLIDKRLKERTLDPINGYGFW